MSIIGTIAAIAANGAQNFGNALIGSYFNRKAASKSNQYALYMSNTAHQREVADLQAAGLNPVLSALGSGASTVATPVASSGDDFQRAQSDTVNSAMRSALKKEQEQADADINLTNQQALQAAAQAKQAAAQAKLATAQADLEDANTAKTLQDWDIAHEQRGFRLQELQQKVYQNVWNVYLSRMKHDWFRQLPPATQFQMIFSQEFKGGPWEKLYYQAMNGLSASVEGFKSLFRKSSDEEFLKKLPPEIELIYTPKGSEPTPRVRDAIDRERFRGQKRVLPVHIDAPSPLHSGQSVMHSSARRFSRYS